MQGAEVPDSTTEREELPTWQIVAAVGVALLVLVAGVVVAWSVFDDDDAGIVVVGPTVTTEPVPTVGVRDDFERPDATELGTSSSGDPWSEISGAWGIDAGTAQVLEPAATATRSLAIVDMGEPDGSVSATMSAAANGWGLVFRYRGKFNYWIVSAAPKFATYNVQKVVDGELVTVGSLGLAPVGDGAVVRVELRGNSIEVFVDDVLAGNFEDPHLAGATLVGLSAEGAAIQEGRWDAFEAVPAGPEAP